LSFAQMEGKCYCCGKPGHKSPECRSKEKIPREEWAINKSQQQHVQSKNDDAKSTSRSTITTTKEAVVGWTGLHCSFAQIVDMKELILLDSDSTETVFYNPKYVTNIRESNYPLSVYPRMEDNSNRTKSVIFPTSIMCGITRIQSQISSV
jgi:hypothetical protein